MTNVELSGPIDQFGGRAPDWLKRGPHVSCHVHFADDPGCMRWYAAVLLFMWKTWGNCWYEMLAEARETHVAKLVYVSQPDA